jgi:hypothetical protein
VGWPLAWVGKTGQGLESSLLFLQICTRPLSRLILSI